MVSINTNLSSLMVQSNLNQATNGLNKAIERLSTGYKINHASDNAANYSIANSYESKLSSYEVAASNVQSGLDLLSVAQDTISTMQDHGSRLQALITQARNGTYGAQSLTAMTQEAGAIISEIQRMYTNAEYNGINLFEASEKKLIIPDGVGLTTDITPKANGFIADIVTVTPDIVVESAEDLEDAIADNSIIGIANADVLHELATLVNSGINCSGKTITLTDDIDLSDYQSGEGWTVIGTEYECSFQGTFDGQGHKIKNLKINNNINSGYYGLFGYCEGNIQNLGIENAYVSVGKSIAGSIAGQLDANINNCYSTGTISSKYNSYGAGTGGLVGAFMGEINNSYSTCNVTGVGGGGGLVGIAIDGGSITNSFATGNVTGESLVGGLIGESCGISINNCYATSNVHGEYLVGGLCGHFMSGFLTNSYATGDVTGTSDSIGGLVGELDDATINKCYATGKVQGEEMVGGIAGLVYAELSPSIMNTISYVSVSGNEGVGTFIGGVDKECGNTLTLASCKSITQDGIRYIGNAYNGETITSDSYITGYLSSIEETEAQYKFIDKTTTLQVGIQGDESSRISFDTTFKYNLADILSDIKSDKAYSTITQFMSTLSAKATDLGSVSNRLESSLESIAVNMENLAGSLSTVKDVDMSEVSSEYIKKQILQQASATLLATANQSPAIALQLI